MKIIKSKTTTNWLYIIIIIFVASLTAIIILGHQHLTTNELEGNQIAHNDCLADDEIASYKESEEGIFRGTVKILIKNQNNDIEKFSFQIDSVSRAGHAIEMYKCNIYVTRVFNVDEERGVPLPNYRTELWRFHYDGSGEKLIDLFKKEGAPDNYGQIFIVDPSESYVALERKYRGDPNYALVIKSLKSSNLEDVFVLKYDDLINKYSAPQGYLSIGRWRDNGQYFWGSIFIGARTLAFLRTKVSSWETEVFIVSEEASTVSSINETGEYISYDNGPGWIGVHEIAQQIYDEWRKEGKKISLFLYNLFTKERTILATIDDPEWFFDPKWISDTELEYYMPSGERRVYNVEK